VKRRAGARVDRRRRLGEPTVRRIAGLWDRCEGPAERRQERVWRRVCTRSSYRRCGAAGASARTRSWSRRPSRLWGS